MCVASEETKVGSVVDELEELEKQQERLSKVCIQLHPFCFHLGNNFCVYIDSVRSEEMAEHRGPGKTCETERFQ